MIYSAATCQSCHKKLSRRYMYDLLPDFLMYGLLMYFGFKMYILGDGKYILYMLATYFSIELFKFRFVPLKVKSQ